MKITPYTKIDNQWTFSDEEMIFVFNKMQEFGLIRKVFSEGLVKTSAEFMDYFQNHKKYMVALIGDEGDILAINWIGGVNKNSAFLHFCLMPEVWGSESYKIGRAFIDYWFHFKGPDGVPIFDVLLGKIPVHNRTAIRFMKKAGMKIVGEIPKISWDHYRQEWVGAVFSYIERDPNERAIDTIH